MQTCRFGLSAWTCRRLSNEYIGQHHGSLFQNKAFQNTWFGWSKILYRDQQGQVVGSNGCSRSFAIHGGVRQGCVLSPRLFCSVLEMSMGNWRDEMKHLDLDLCDGGRSLLDLRFADDILIFGTDYHVIGVLLDKLVENLTTVGLQLNTEKTKVLTTQAQPPLQLQTPNGLIISVLNRESSHKWLGCMLTTAPVQTTTCDVECRLQATARAFNANRWVLCSPKVSLAQKLEYFDRVISPIACFAAGHRTIYRTLAVFDRHDVALSRC